MKKVLLVVVVLTCLMMTGLQTAVSAAELVLEPLPAELKTPAEGAVYQDDAFFKEADAVIKGLSNRTVPTESQRMKVYSAYSAVRGMSVSPENYAVANNILAFLYYTAKTGEAYENFFNEKKSVVAVTDGTEYYDLAAIYYYTATNWWALIADRYPNVTMYTLPDKNSPLPAADIAMGQLLDGLKYPLIIPQKTPNTDKSFEDQEFETTISRWIEDYVEAIPNQTDLKEETKGHYFILSDGPKWAKSTYMGLTIKNVRPEFYDTANYIDAFLYYLSQAREYYEQSVTDRTSYVSNSDGSENYNLAKAYYDEAGKALSLFKDKIPAINNTTTLPMFPEIREVPIGSTTIVAQTGLW
ncbi:MAG: hypothetical protein CVV33_06605 [Methanomicrobiales archaeon HGW-Methanomicrobiales-4]|nr:MAG: hypothetical protein CVV33_06605 [Methanomicrobiales archaeon HGW-Methanomicrobiales-4]